MLFMKIARLIAEESKCCKYKVGAVIVRDGKIIGHGCNGTLPGMVDCNKYAANEGWTVNGVLRDSWRANHRSWSTRNELHAEMNAIINAGTDVSGCDLYVTMVPCEKCAIMIAGFKFKKIYYSDLHHTHGLKFLEKAGVICEQV